MKNLVLSLLFFIPIWGESLFAQKNFVKEAFGNVNYGDTYDIRYNKIYASYGYSYSDHPTGNMVAIGYLYGFNITSQKIPLYLEFGAQFDWSKYSNVEIERKDVLSNYSKEEYSDSRSGLTCNIPINLVYKINLSNDISFSPFIGYNNKIHSMNLTGKTKELHYHPGINLGCSIEKSHFYAGYKFVKDFESAHYDRLNIYSHVISIGYIFY